MQSFMQCVRSAALVAPMLGIAFVSPANGMETDPLDAVPAPDGVSALLLYAQDAESTKQYSHGSQVGENTIESQVAVLRYVHYFTIGGSPASVNLLQPYGTLSLNGGSETTGVGDTIFAAAYWPYSDREKQRYFAIAPYLVAPTGKYHRDASLNLGENRWRFTLQGALSWALSSKWVWDAVADVEFFGDNKEAPTGTRLSQDEKYSVQTHVSYRVADSITASIGAYRYFGGETAIDGVKQDDESRAIAGIAGVQYAFTPRNMVQLQYRHDAEVENGARFGVWRLRFSRAL
jgi:hypothetical protein